MARSRIWYPILLLPVILLFAQIYLIQQYRWTIASKDFAETSALVVLGAAFVICVARWIRVQHAFLAWLSAWIGAFLLREIHLDGTSTFIYLAMLGLLLIGWWQYARLADYLGGRITLTLLAGVFFTYFVSVGCDKKFWTFLADDFLLQHAEEFLELPGHLQLLLLSLLCRPASGLLAATPARESSAVVVARAPAYATEQ